MAKENTVGVVIGALLTAIFLLGHGVYILKTGGFFRWGRPGTEGKEALGMARRIAYAALFLFSGGAVLAVLTSFAVRKRLTLSGALHSLVPVWLPLLFGLSMLGVSLRAMINPASMIRTVKHAHPEIDEYDPAAQRVIRLRAHDKKVT